MDRLGDMLFSSAGDIRGFRCFRFKDIIYIEDRGICF